MTLWTVWNTEELPQARESRPVAIGWCSGVPEMKCTLQAFADSSSLSRPAPSCCPSTSPVPCLPPSLKGRRAGDKRPQKRARHAVQRLSCRGGGSRSRSTGQRVLYSQPPQRARTQPLSGRDPAGFAASRRPPGAAAARAACWTWARPGAATRGFAATVDTCCAGRRGLAAPAPRVQRPSAAGTACGAAAAGRAVPAATRRWARLRPGGPGRTRPQSAARRPRPARALGVSAARPLIRLGRAYKVKSQSSPGSTSCSGRLGGGRGGGQRAWALFSATENSEVPEDGAGRRERGTDGGMAAPALMTVAPPCSASCEGGVHDGGAAASDALDSGASTEAAEGGET